MKKILVFVVLLLAILSVFAIKPKLEPGVAVIKLKPGYQPKQGANHTGISTLDSKLSGLGIYEISPRFVTKRKDSSELSRILKISFNPQLDPLAVCNALKNEPNLEYAEPIYIEEAFATPDDLYFPNMSYFTALEAAAAWDIHKGENGSSPIILAVVDTGVRWTHPDLAQNIWQNLDEDANGNGYTIYYNGSTWVYDPGDINGIDDDGNGYVDDLIGWDFKLNAGDAMHMNPYESSGHGTRVSGIANARTNNAIGVCSVAWNVTLMPVSCSYPGSLDIFRGYDGILYAAENGAHVINCSWGGTTYSQASQDVINYIYNTLGCVIVAASGNDNAEFSRYPSGYDNVVAVVNVSNAGVHAGGNYGAQIDVAAPTTGIRTTEGATYTATSGATSYASPIASSLASLIWSYNPTWTNAQVVRQLKATCDNIDAQNPTLAGKLGEGRLNARRALSEVDPPLSQIIKLSMVELMQPSDTNANGAAEPGETFSINLTLRNHSETSPLCNAVYTLSTSNPAVNILQNTYNGQIPTQSRFDLLDAFEILVLPDAISQFVTFTLSITADYPITVGSSFTFDILINAGGVFVWEPVAGARNQSGSYIRDQLAAKAGEVLYANTFPTTFHAFTAVYLSFGAVDANIGRFSDPTMFYAIKEYLEAGGRLYIEGEDAIGYDLANYFPLIDGISDGHEILWPLLGIASAEDGGPNPIDNLQGQPHLPTQGMTFTATNQTSIQYIDTFEPLPVVARSAFIESDYGTVAVIGAGGYGQRTLVFSYALSELVDGSYPSTRGNLLNKIVEFFNAEDATLPVTLSSFTVSWANNPLIKWQTASETELLGWNILRGLDQEPANAARINPRLIPPAEDSSLGSSYSFADLEIPTVEYLYYWLEALSYTGTTTLYGHLKLKIPQSDEPDPPYTPEITNGIRSIFPNPFTNGVNINISISEKHTVLLEVFNLKGQKIRTIIDQEIQPGSSSWTWDGQDCKGQAVSDGIYFVRMSSPKGYWQKKMVKS